MIEPRTKSSALPSAARFTIAMFAIAGFGIAIYALLFQMDPASVEQVALLAAAAVLSKTKVNIFERSTLSLLTAVVLFAVIQNGLGTAVLAGLVGVTIQTISANRKLVVHQLAFNAGMIVVTVAASWSTYRIFTIHTATDPISAELMATIFASFVYFMGNSLSVSWVIALTRKTSMVRLWMDHFLHTVPSFLIAGLLALAVTGLLVKGAGVLLILTAVVSVAYCSSVRLIRSQYLAQQPMEQT